MGALLKEKTDIGLISSKTDAISSVSPRREPAASGKVDDLKPIAEKTFF